MTKAKPKTYIAIDFESDESRRIEGYDELVEYLDNILETCGDKYEDTTTGIMDMDIYEVSSTGKVKHVSLNYVVKTEWVLV